MRRLTVFIIGAALTVATIGIAVAQDLPGGRLWIEPSDAAQASFDCSDGYTKASTPGTQPSEACRRARERCYAATAAVDRCIENDNCSMAQLERLMDAREDACDARDRACR